MCRGCPRTGVGYVPGRSISRIEESKTWMPGTRRGVANRRLRIVGLLAVLLDACGPQAGEPVLVDRILPGQEFLDRQRIAAARLLEREQPATDGGHHFGLASNDPALSARCRQIGDRQGAAVRPDNILGPRSKGLRNGITHALD